MIAKLDQLLPMAMAKGPRRVAVPMARDPDIIGCIGEAMQRGLATFILVGNRDHIVQLGQENGVDVSAAEFIYQADDGVACNLCAQLVRDGKADILMKGVVSTTTFSKAFLNKELALVPPGQLVSHVALFEVPSYHKLLIITDAGLNIAPGLDAKKAIIRNAVDFAIRIGIERPKVACVAANEKVNSAMPSTMDGAELRRLGAAGFFAPAIVDGPFGLDVAVSKKAAQIKSVAGEVAGDADILLMPGIDAANATYKTLTQFADCLVASIIAGAKCPIVVTSRSDNEQVKLMSLGMAICMCQ